MKKVINLVIDLSIVLLAVTAIAMGMKNSYIGYNNDVLTAQSLEQFNNSNNTENFSDRSEFNPRNGDVIATVQVMGVTDIIPIIEGDSEANLSRGATHLIQTGYPGDSRQIFLSAHRDVHFQELEHVEIGDTVIVTMPYGEYEYIVSDTKIIHETDVHVIKTEMLEQDELVLMTCYPFSNITNPERRFLVYAYPKPIEE